MALSQVQGKILSPFIAKSVECVRTMAGLEAKAGESFAENLEKFWLDDYAVVVETSGQIEGTVLLHIYIETALALGKKIQENMFGEAIDDAMDIDEDIVQSLMEFGNTVVGLATREFKGSDLGIVFDPPYFVTDMEERIDELFADVKEVISVPIEVKGVGRFYLNYLLRQETEIQ